MSVIGSGGVEESIADIERSRTIEKKAPPKRPRGSRNRDAVPGWLFIAPAVIVIVVFVLLPVISALWVSLSDWTGKGSPLKANFIGVDNYQALLTKPGLAQRDLATSLRNNMYYVLLVVPLQTILALLLATTLNRRRLRGKGFFRSAFYFPSVTSSVAISIVFLFLFNASGVVNAILAWFGINGPNWFADPRGVGHILLGLVGVDTESPPEWQTSHDFLGLTWWQWWAGPSVAMCALITLAVWTTSGTFMLLFLAALQDIPDDVQEAAMVDGTSTWQRFRAVTLPALKPTMFLVLTLGLIGTWQVFDAVYIMSQGAPAKTTLTPAFLSYQASFTNGKWGQGAAIAFILFAIIVVFSLIQRFVMRDRATLARSRRIASWEGK
ncbi:carbohydrate ABC transporter permease [Nakamurella sp. GG22]